MAKLYEYQGKALLNKGGIVVPKGKRAATAEEAGAFAAETSAPVVVKAQAWVTGRKAMGGVKFAETPKEAEKAARDILGMDVKGFRVREVLVEERLNIDREFYLGMIIDDAERCPIIVFSTVGGTGIEEVAKQFPHQVARRSIRNVKELKGYDARNLLVGLDIRGTLQEKLSAVIVKFFKICVSSEARSAEINPLVLAKDGQIIAADCHMVIDDYAVFRHPELGIDIAREFDRPPTDLERVAYAVEAKDHRGTFYFLQMEQEFEPRAGYVGFHGAGGGGAMMSMNALLSQGFKMANYCDTSGNPSAAKVYRAAKIILSQKNIDGYFASGSGVASQEQFHSARGLVKAFREVRPNIPAVIRIGGNSEKMAIDILHTFTQDLPAKIEAYGRDTTAAFCAKRLRELVDGWKYDRPVEPAPDHPKGHESNYRFETLTGTIYCDHEKCQDCEAKPCIEACKADILKLEGSGPVLSVSPEEAKRGKCTECLACELECKFNGNKGIFIDLSMPNLNNIK